MTRNRLDLALRHCADLCIDVEWSDMGDFRRGEYRRQRNLITLNVRLTAAQAAATCGHELGHERFGDTCSTPANERRAWQYGAALLITPAEYRFAESLVGPHPGALALDLGVTPKLIHAWRDWWTVRGHRLSRGDDDPLGAELVPSC